MRRSTLGIILALVALLAIVGVVMANNRQATPTTTPSSDTATNNDTNTSTEEPTASESGSLAVETDEVEIENNAFTPSAIKVKKGTTVTWTNKDSVEHTVTPDVAGSFTGSGMLGKDETFSVTFDEVGTFTYHCIPHPDMQGSVEVVEA